MIKTLKILVINKLRALTMNRQEMQIVRLFLNEMAFEGLPIWIKFNDRCAVDPRVEMIQAECRFLANHVEAVSLRESQRSTTADLSEPR